MDERARTLLKTLVEHYIADGQPVGSRALSKFSGLDLSPATIRNVMADLVEAGFVASPHTSAGRVPTARGYRLFVDSLLTVQPLAAGHPLRDVPNTVLTPHVAGLSRESAAYMSQVASEEVVRVLTGQRPRNLINPEALEAHAARRKALSP